MQSYGVTGANNTILSIATVCTGCATSSQTPLIVGLVVGLIGGLSLIGGGLYYYLRVSKLKAKSAVKPTPVSSAVPWQHGDDAQSAGQLGSTPAVHNAGPGHASPPGMVS